MRVTNITATWLACAAIVASTMAQPAFAQEPEAADASAEGSSGEVAPARPSLDYQGGDILLPNKVATLHLGEKYRYLNPADTEKMLVSWGNPPGFDAQGAIVPTDVEPFSDDGWAVILTYKDEGHVDDSDAAEIDYDELLENMQEETKSENAARKQAGFGSVQLVGWAEKPHYDMAMKKLYWAQELNFDGSPANTLNYDVRVLGREGVLSMNAVGTMSQLQQIRADMQPLIQVVEFNEGYRYAEFNAKTDRMAEYGLGALIAGAAAAKLGLFAKLGVFLLAAKKFIFAGLIALAALLSKIFGKKKDEAA